MNEALFYLIIIGLLCLSARNKDLIDTWWLYIDDTLVKECNENFGYCSIELKKMDLFLGSKNATIRYFRDTPCDDCPTSIQVKNMQDSLLFEATSYGTTTPISFPLRLFWKHNKYNSFKIYFKEENDIYGRYQTQIFQIDIK